MKYFLHDTSSFDDEKITELFINFGYEGLGLFYTILEKLGKQEKPIKTDVLKRQLRVGKKLLKCWNFLEEIELISSKNGETFNKQLLNFSEKYKIRSEKNRKRILQWRENQSDEKNVTHSEFFRNDPKVKLSKVNRILKKEIDKKKSFGPVDEFEIENQNSIAKFDLKKLGNSKKFIEPLLNEIEEYFLQSGSSKIEAKKFWSFYDSKNWMVGKNKMAKWRSAASGWISRNGQNLARPESTKKTILDVDESLRISKENILSKINSKNENRTEVFNLEG